MLIYNFVVNIYTIQNSKGQKFPEKIMTSEFSGNMRIYTLCSEYIKVSLKVYSGV